jgi:hypothetical protein
LEVKGHLFDRGLKTEPTIGYPQKSLPTLRKVLLKPLEIGSKTVFQEEGYAILFN